MVRCRQLEASCKGYICLQLATPFLIPTHLPRTHLEIPELGLFISPKGKFSHPGPLPGWTLKYQTGFDFTRCPMNSLCYCVISYVHDIMRLYIIIRLHVKLDRRENAFRFAL